MNALDYPVDPFQLMVHIATYLRDVDAQLEEQHYHYGAFGSWWLRFAGMARSFGWVTTAEIVGLD